MRPNYLFKTRRQAIARARRKYGVKDYGGAIAEWDELLERNQEDALAWLGRFDCLFKLDKKEEMLQIGDRVCEMWPQSEAAHNNYACLLLESGEYQKACRYFDLALAIAPERNMYYFNAGLAYRGAGKPNEALICFEHVLENEPDHQRALEFLSQLYLEFGFADKLIDLSMRLRMLRPGYTYPLQRRLYAMVNDPQISEQEIDIETSLMRSALVNRPSAYTDTQVLRVGWVVCPYSSRFLQYVMPAIRRQRDLEQVVLVGYCNSPQIDRELLDTLFDQVYTTEPPTPQAFAELVNTHPSDVMIDSAGQVPNNLLQIYSARLAPLQISWPFFQSRTELVLMDQAFVDEHIHPVVRASSNPAPGNSISIGDRLTHLSTGQFFYEGDELKTLSQSPCENNKHITFGVVADPIQVNADCVGCWAEIMKKTSGSKLIFFHRQFPSVILERYLSDMFAAVGVKPDRIEFVARSAEHAARYDCFADIDILLSPFPLSDDLALADGMWMGVPPVTLACSIAGRCRAGSIMSAADMTENLAANKAEYVERGIAIGKDRKGLIALRKALRDQLKRSALMQSEEFVANFFREIIMLRG